jgi:hypothetical protein
MPMIDAVASVPKVPVQPRTIEVSVRGKWVNVPAIDINGQTFVVRGKRIRIASLHDEDYLAHGVIDPAECVRILKELQAGIRADIFHFSQREPDIRPHFEYPAELRSLAVANVSSYDAWWQKVSHGTKCNVRQAKKRGVEVRVQVFNDDLVRGIIDIQNESPIRQGRRFYHYGKPFEQVKRDHGSFLDSCDFICAHVGKELIGFLKLIYRGDTATIMQLNSKLAWQQKRPTNALLEKAAELCASKGVSCLVYGDLSLWNKRGSSLRDFKLRNGFEEMLVPSYYVPLTPWGSFCVKTKLYRGRFGMLPGSLISAGLELRRRWYDYASRNNKGRNAADESGSARGTKGSFADDSA